MSASLFEFVHSLLKAAAAALTALSPVVSGGAAFVFAPGSLAAAKRAGAALPSATAATIDAGTCRTDLPYLLGQGEEGSEVEACRAVAQEVELEIGDTLVLVRPSLAATPAPAPAPTPAAAVPLSGSAPCS